MVLALKEDGKRKACSMNFKKPIISMFIGLVLTGMMIFSLTAAAATPSENSGKALAFEGKRIEVNGIHLNVFDQGKGEVVLLLHGMPDTLNVWKNQIPVLLKAGYRVVAPDLIGYGKSDKPKELEHYKSGECREGFAHADRQIGSEGYQSHWS